MANINDTFSKAWKAADLDEPKVFTISEVESTKIGGERKLVVSFKESARDLICNKTNAKVIALGYGDETDAWIGKKIQIYNDPNVEYAGEKVGGIRVRTPKGAAPEPPADFDDGPPPISDFDDDIPF
jgi:hypothetical protein